MSEGTILTKYSTSDSHFLMGLRTAAGMTSDLKDFPALYFPYRVIRAWGIMIGAGAAGDTVKVQKVSGGSATDITDAVDVSAKVDKAFFNFGTIDDAQFETTEGDNIRVLTASDALCEIWVECIKLVTTP